MHKGGPALCERRIRGNHRTKGSLGTEEPCDRVENRNVTLFKPLFGVA